MIGHKAVIKYRPTTNPCIWDVFIDSEETAMLDHFGFVYSDEAGLYSMHIYPTFEGALEALTEYTEDLFDETQEHTR